MFDANPTSTKAKVTEYVVLGGRDIKMMAQEAPDLRNRNKYYSDLKVPITWYCVGGSVADQRKFLIHEVIPDLFVNQGAKDTQIIWIPSHDAKINTCFRTDILEVPDGVTKKRSLTSTTGQSLPLVSASHGSLGESSTKKPT